MNLKHHWQAGGRLQLCGETEITIEGRTYVPDRDTAFVEMFLSHAFPVTTIDGTALHPQVVANSYASLRNKVFDLNHIVRSYNPEQNKEDRILGTIVGVEFPSPLTAEGQGRGIAWKVQGDRASAPGIRAVAAMHKQADGVRRILQQWVTGSIPWTVSMEQDYYLEDSGFLVKAKAERWAKNTPADLAALGWIYVDVAEAPEGLLACFDAEGSKITKHWGNAETLILFGGLDGRVYYRGAGLTPAGKEPEARVGQMLASASTPASAEAMAGGEDGKVPEVVELISRIAGSVD